MAPAQIKEIVMKSLFLLLALTGCAHPVTSTHWGYCELICADNDGAREACVSFFKGDGCTCFDNTTIWMKERTKDWKYSR